MIALLSIATVALLALGVLTIFLALSQPRTTIADRVLPFVTPQRVRSRPAPRPNPIRQCAFACMRSLDAVFGRAGTARRLAQCGSVSDVDEFRLRQLRWAVYAMVSIAGLGCMRAFMGNPIEPVRWLLLVVVAGVAAICIADYLLTRRVRTRMRQIANELPAIAELLAFSVGAGLSPQSALARVSRRTTGTFSSELALVVDDIGSGTRFPTALATMANRLDVACVTQFVDALSVAVERGTPLAEVLRAQAADARASAHRELMAEAGRREIFAMVPVVFLVLPLVVLVAVFPGIHGLMVMAP